MLEFLHAVSEVFLQSCTKDQLLQIASHYGIDIVDKKHEGEIKDFVLAALLEQGVIKGELVLDEATPAPAPVPVSVAGSDLTFEQRRELILLQFKQEKMTLQMKLQVETEWQLQVEKIHSETEIMKLELDLIYL